MFSFELCEFLFNSACLIKASVASCCSYKAKQVEQTFDPLDAILSWHPQVI